MHTPGAQKRMAVMAQPVVSACGVLALIPIDKAAFSYQPKDLKSVRRAVRNRLPLETFLGRDLPSTLRDTVWLKLLSLGDQPLFSRGAIEASNQWRMVASSETEIG